MCDRRADMGVDALVVNDDAEEIVLFQAKRKQKIPATLGDSDLKAFIGALTQFKNKAAIEKVIATTENIELKNLLVTHKVADKVEQGYVIRLIFVANIAADANATRYASLTQDSGTSLSLWDLNRIAPVLKQLKREWFVTQRVKLKINSEKSFVDGPRSNP